MKLLIATLLLVAAASGQTTNDPYANVPAEQRQAYKAVIERFVRDQIKQNWADLWEIQDQTPDMKNTLLQGDRNAPDLSKDQFVQAMRYTVGSGSFPRLRSFTLREIKKDKEGFVMIGCGKATREAWKQTGFVIAGIRLVNGTPKIDIWSMTSDSCTPES